ncbi:uncharacterized protein LOC133801858 [Humulus lupulus]|uniref:uncharacterized protein LOC133801858 n=1 Tax=Humulus lupulus TaxID=3486 RepID=UPI002B404186|nr:uncharacterized protein LOC133801858 [Humulus lupulus]
MRPPPSLHSSFFSSLKQVEKRLKLEEQQSHPQPEPSTHSLSTQSSLSSPIYLQLNHSNHNQDSSTLQESSEPPQQFLSCSPEFLPTHQIPIQSNVPELPKPVTETQSDPVCDIEGLIQLLGLSENGEERQEEASSCHCENGFYSKIAKVKGPKCAKEVERLEGWIDYFLNGGNDGEEKIEPFRLSLLLLGKAAFVSQGADGGFGGLEFPSTIEEFLLNDPPPTTI